MCFDPKISPDISAVIKVLPRRILPNLTSLEALPRRIKAKGVR